MWTWTANDPDTKLVPSSLVGMRDLDDAMAFMSDLGSRLVNRVQFTTDGHRPYIEAIEAAFGSDVDYAQLIKDFGVERRSLGRNRTPAMAAGVTDHVWTSEEIAARLLCESGTTYSCRMACMFCGSAGPMSEEDVVPLWAGRALDATGRVVLRRGPDGTFVREYTGLRVKLPGVCVSCNTGWMSRLENTVKPWLSPAIRGEEIVLAMPQQRVVAFWAAKTALLYELAMRKRRAAMPLPDSNLRWIYEHRNDQKPIPGSFVWLAALDPDNTSAHDKERYTVSDQVTSSLRHDGKGSGSDWAFANYLVTFTIGCLVVQVFGQDFSDDTHSPDGRPLAILFPPSSIESFQVRLWPRPDHVVIWPAPNTLTTITLNEFGGGWLGTLSYYVVGLGSSRRIVFADSDNRARFGTL